MEVAPTWSMDSVVRVLRDTLGMIVAMVMIVSSIEHCIRILMLCVHAKCVLLLVGKTYNYYLHVTYAYADTSNKVA